jgi:4-hydroxy-tetrahydrodipicolinate synthase
MKKLYGLTTAMITPYDNKGKLNLDMVGEMTRFQIERGTHCLYPGGTTGEMYLLSEEERKALAKATVDAGKGKANIFIHVGAMTQDETIRLAQHASEIGADGIGVVTPSYFKVTDGMMVNYFTTIANSVPNDFPIYLYNIPQCSGNDLKPDTIRQIIDRAPNVVGIKYSFADFVRTIEYVGIAEDFSVVIGADILFHSGLAMGCTGTVSGVASVYPEPFVAIYDAFLKGDQEKARRIQKKAVEIANLLKNGSNRSYFKIALKHRGYDVGGMRAPLMDLSDEEQQRLVEQLNVWEDSALGEF